MGCLINKGVKKVCKMVLGGLSEMYVGNIDEIAGVVYDAEGRITDLQLLPAAEIFRFEFEDNTAGIDQPIVVGTNTYVTPTVNMSLAGYEQERKEVVELLVLGKTFVVGKQRSNGLYIAAGIQNGLKATAGGGNTGLLAADFSGFLITLVGEETEFANEILKSAVDAIFVAPNEPQIFNVDPLTYAILGGDAFTLTGEGFTGATAVTFVNTVTAAEIPATSFVVVDDNTITGVSDAMAAADYKIKVVNPYGYGESIVEVTAS